MRPTKWLVLTLAALAFTGVLGACGSSSSSGKPIAELTATKDLQFTPNKFSVKFNQEVVFTLRNTDTKNTHNFTISSIFTDPDHFVNVDVPPGQSREVKFTVTQRPAIGYFTFYCRFHQSQGMTGRMTLS